MPSVSKSKLKAKMFEYFRQVEESGQALIVTDHGTPVLKILPLDFKKAMKSNQRLRLAGGSEPILWR